MKRSTLLISAMATVTLGLAGCGGGPSDPDTTSVIRIGMTTEGGSNYDPVTNPNAFAMGYLKPVFDTLLVRDESGAFTAGLATSWTAAPDGTAVTLKLREGVTFHDGAPFNAAAVVTNLERARTATASVLKGELSKVTAVRAIDDSNVEVALSGGAGAFLGSLTGRVGMIGSPTKLTDASFANRPIGAGPWAVSSDSVVGQTMVYTAYENYWNKSVQTVDRIELKLVTAESMHSALLGKQIDIGSLEGRRDQIPQLERSGFTKHVFPSVPYQYVLYLRKTGPLADERVRKAISLGLDRATINSQVLESACTPQAGIQALPGAGETNTPTQDKDEARRLLAEAGHAGGVEIKIVVSSAGPGSKILQAMQGQLGDVGIRLTINPMARAQLLSTYVGGGADGYFTVNTGDADPAPLVTQLTTTMSPGGYVDSTLNGLADQGANAVEGAERSAAYKAWNARFAGMAFAIGLCNLELPYLVAAGVQGLKIGSPLHVEPRGLRVG